MGGVFHLPDHLRLQGRLPQEWVWELGAPGAASEPPRGKMSRLRRCHVERTDVSPADGGSVNPPGCLAGAPRGQAHSRGVGASCGQGWLPPGVRGRLRYGSLGSVAASGPGPTEAPCDLCLRRHVRCLLPACLLFLLSPPVIGLGARSNALRPQRMEVRFQKRPGSEASGGRDSLGNTVTPGHTALQILQN